MTAPEVDPPRGRGGPDLRVDIELMRVVAILMVVAVHATGASISAAVDAGDRGAGYWLALAVNEASRAGVPVFLLITGWALLRRDVPRDGAWLRLRVAGLAVPLVAWTAVYVLEAAAIGAARGALPWAADGPAGWLLHELRIAVLGPGVRGHLWYLYVAIALTLLTWLVRNAHVGSAVPRRQLALVAVALVLPYGVAEILGRDLAWGDFAWALAYGALGVVVLEMAPRRWIGATLFAGASLALVLLIDTIGFETWPSTHPSPVRLIAGVGLAWLLTGLPRSPRLRAAAVRLGGLTFGVYLVHPLVLTVLGVPVRAAVRAGVLPGALAVPLLLAGAIAGSFLVVAAWHRVPRLARVLG